ncbi:hypothetical protein CRM22_010519 [Opisthorchis felineus]|uniref:Uncharacterized protein n=1 Tax=Opisthorchis felineus TaxID=147828 RepID=A0A4V6RGN9_OPIFE|nr:hypothetical protein CRM22_010519 [Opisthorchis felineus]
MGTSHGKQRLYVASNGKEKLTLKRQNYRGLSSERRLFIDHSYIRELSDFKPAFENPLSDYRRQMRASSPCLAFTTDSSNKAKSNQKVRQNLCHVSVPTASQTRSGYAHSNTLAYDNSLEFSGNVRHTTAARRNKAAKRHQLRRSEENNKGLRNEPKKADSYGTDAASESGLFGAHDYSDSGDRHNLVNTVRASDKELSVGNQQDIRPLETGISSSLNVRLNTRELNYPEMSTGDMATAAEPAFTNISERQDCYSASTLLTDKPPTPPQKSKTTNLPTLPERWPPRPAGSAAKIRAADSGLQFSPMNRLPTPKLRDRTPSARSSSLSRPSTSDGWSRIPQDRVSPLTVLKPRRSSSISQKSESESNTDKQQNLSRIEYTFYINDTEAYQRPFYDRRVEAIARASQCSISLHKPPPGHKPVYYKGIRVLPVTISSRTMVSLKRCIARLDMQYPYFNVKAFCPPDMY